MCCTKLGNEFKYKLMCWRLTSLIHPKIPHVSIPICSAINLKQIFNRIRKRKKRIKKRKKKQKRKRGEEKIEEQKKNKENKRE